VNWISPRLRHRAVMTALVEKCWVCDVIVDVFSQHDCLFNKLCCQTLLHCLCVVNRENWGLNFDCVGVSTSVCCSWQSDLYYYLYTSVTKTKTVHEDTRKRIHADGASLYLQHKSARLLYFIKYSKVPHMAKNALERPLVVLKSASSISFTNVC